jgi:hypothetical protein
MLHVLIWRNCEMRRNATSEEDLIWKLCAERRHWINRVLTLLAPPRDFNDNVWLSTKSIEL